MKNIDEIQKSFCESAAYPGMKNPVLGIQYLALGLTGEAGEVSDEIKKMMRDDLSQLTLSRRRAIILELADTFWYLSMIATELQIPLSEVVQLGKEKIDSRKRNSETKQMKSWGSH